MMIDMKFSGNFLFEKLDVAVEVEWCLKLKLRRRENNNKKKKKTK